MSFFRIVENLTFRDSARSPTEVRLKLDSLAQLPVSYALPELVSPQPAKTIG